MDCLNFRMNTLISATILLSAKTQILCGIITSKIGVSTELVLLTGRSKVIQTSEGNDNRNKPTTFPTGDLKE
jgi:hypothetical protein